jgi:hypothetical protein
MHDWWEEQISTDEKSPDALLHGQDFFHLSASMTVKQP